MRILLWTAVTVCFFSCTKKVTQEDLIEAALVLKLDQWKQSQMASCKEKAMTKAEAYVDSVLLATSLKNNLDTISKPPKPMKPIKPVFKEKPDSLKIDEVIKKKE